MIEPVTPKPRPQAVQESPAVEPVGRRTDQQGAEAGQPDAAARRSTAEAAAAQRVAPVTPGFEVVLDGDTLRLYSEMRDPETDRVILRLPTGYEPRHEPPRKHKPDGSAE